MVTAETMSLTMEAQQEGITSLLITYCPIAITSGSKLAALLSCRRSSVPVYG